ncbi:uncharacterized protein LOC128138184 [Harpia harpyja]|uniref:uncharacterized protein LOC128138184 n=1 Tax=Harpia harpyja TaxID=202280 RepID=UPI0022B1ED15|nr:uncharacterized protein LOC128138184 [Harpia harpyja]
MPPREVWGCLRHRWPSSPPWTVVVCLQEKGVLSLPQEPPGATANPTLLPAHPHQGALPASLGTPGPSWTCMDPPPDPLDLHRPPRISLDTPLPPPTPADPLCLPRNAPPNPLNLPPTPLTPDPPPNPPQARHGPPPQDMGPPHTP